MTRTQLITLLRSTAASPETLHHVMHVWRDEHPSQPQRSEVLAHCCRILGCTIENAKSQKRESHYVTARNLFVYYFCVYHSGAYTLKALSAYLGGRDHTTAIHGRDVFKKYIEAKDDVAIGLVNSLLSAIASSGHTSLPPIRLKRMQPKYKSVRKYIYDHHTGEDYETMIELNKALGLPAYTAFNDVKRKFGILRFEWKERK